MVWIWYVLVKATWVRWTLYLLEARKMLMRALCSLLVTWSWQSTEQIRGFPASHWGPYARRITRNFCLFRIPLCIIILLIMLHMKRKATGGMNHVLVSLGINNWDRVRSLWELLVRGRWLSVPNWQTWCVSSRVSSEQTSNLTCHIDQSPWVSYDIGCDSAMRAQWELSLLCVQEHFTVPPKWVSYVPLHQDFYWNIEGISHWLDMKGIEHLTCIVPQTVPQYSIY